MKITFGKNEDMNYVVAVAGVASDFFKQPFGRRLDDLRAIETWKQSAKRGYADCKGKPTISGVKAWIKLYWPEEVYACWRADGPMHKHDSVEVFYK
jgi:hypothetical protein